MAGKVSTTSKSPTFEKARSKRFENLRMAYPLTFYVYNNLSIYSSFAVAWLVGLFSFLPVLASILSFVSPHPASLGLFNAFLDYIQPKWTQSQHSCHFCFPPAFQCRNCFLWFHVDLKKTVFCRSSVSLSSFSHSFYQVMQAH